MVKVAPALLVIGPVKLATPPWSTWKIALLVSELVWVMAPVPVTSSVPALVSPCAAVRLPAVIKVAPALLAIVPVKLATPPWSTWKIALLVSELLWVMAPVPVTSSVPAVTVVGPV